MLMTRSILCLVMMAVMLSSCTPKQEVARDAAGHSVRFVRDTLFEGAGLPVLGETWSPSGRWFILTNGENKSRVVDANGRSSAAPFLIPDHAWLFAWESGDSLLACQFLDPQAASDAGTGACLLRPGREQEPLPVLSELSDLLWLPTGALVGVVEPDEYLLLRQGSPQASTDTCGRLWAPHEDRSSSDHRWVGLAPANCAPEASVPVQSVPGWSRGQFDRNLYSRLWWLPRSGAFIAQSEDGWIRCDAMGRSQSILTPRKKNEILWAIAPDGDLAVGHVNPNPDSPAVRLAFPPFAWSLKNGWRASIDGLEGGICRASASPVDDRFLIETTRGVELGRLVVDR